MHYQRWRKTGDVGEAETRWHRPSRPCRVDGCSEVTHAHGLCGTHYNRLRRWGDPLGGPTRIAISRGSALAAFGHWLAGFIDGEGCFGMEPASRPAPRFALSLRDDDLAILDRIASLTGIGTINRIRPMNGSAPKAVWRLGSKRDCAQLVDLLDRYPLQAKKARDYAVWREAVLFWLRFGPWERTDWAAMREFRQRLRDARRYVPGAAGNTVEVQPTLWAR